MNPRSRLGLLIEPIVLFLLAPFALFPSPTRFVALLVIPALWTWRWKRSRHFIPCTPLDGAVILLALMVLVSLYATYDIAVSLPKIAGLLLGFAVFHAFVRMGEWRAGWWLGSSGLLVGGTSVALLGLLGTEWSHKFSFLAPVLVALPIRITGLPGAESGLHPNEVAGALLWVIPYSLALCIAWSFGFVHSGGHWRVNRRQSLLHAVVLILLGGASLLMAGVFILTQSRGGFIALGATLLLMLLVAGRESRRLVIGVILVALVIGALSYIYVGPDRLKGLAFGSSAGAEQALSLDTLEGRIEVWSRAIYGIQDFPFTGMGMNTFRTVVNVLYPLFLVSPEVDIGHAHNEFLQVALDLGIPGLIAFIALYLGAFWMLFQTWRHARYRLLDYEVWGSNLPIVALVLGLGGGLLAHMLYGLTDAVALGAKPGVLFWMLLGLIVGLYQHIHGDPGVVRAPGLPK